MVSRVSLLPKEGEASDAEVDGWLQDLGQRRSADDLGQLRAAVDMAREAHRHDQAVDGFNLFLSLLHTTDTLDSLKLDIDSQY